VVSDRKARFELRNPLLPMIVKRLRHTEVGPLVSPESSSRTAEVADWKGEKSDANFSMAANPGFVLLLAELVPEGSHCFVALKRIR
jgi:hypothetical protein